MSSTSGRMSSKKRMSYGSDSERSKRLNANLIERRRMQNINCGFSSLKKLLPPSNRKQTKAAILQQASQHILRLQRAIIQFKTENDSLRNTLELERSSHGSSSHLQCGAVKTPRIKPSDYTCDIECASLPPRRDVRMRSIDGGWRMFEHVKKFKPACSETNGFDHQREMYYGMDSIPPTPPVSPLLKDHALMPPTPPVSPLLKDHALRSRGSLIPETSRGLVPKFPTNRQSRGCYPSPEGTHNLQPPKKNIFHSLTLRSPEKTVRTSPRIWSDEQFMSVREERVDDMNEIEGSKQGDLQSIIDAIRIIESTDNL